nr:putative F-box protein PP2-B2 [Aegilops tauschii subsp. strangulata]
MQASKQARGKKQRGQTDCVHFASSLKPPAAFLLHKNPIPIPIPPNQLQLSSSYPGESRPGQSSGRPTPAPTDGGSHPMEEACEIARLPEELLSAALARTSPRDAFHVAAVSPAFRAAADSDDVWASFLPPGGLPPLADGELPPPSSKKELFLRLSAGPVLLQDRLVSMWVDREAGTKCYMLSAWNLQSVLSGDTPDYPRRVPLDDSSRNHKSLGSLVLSGIMTGPPTPTLIRSRSLPHSFAAVDPSTSPTAAAATASPWFPGVRMMTAVKVSTAGITSTPPQVQTTAS